MHPVTRSRAPHAPSACPACGAYSLAPTCQTSALLAVCDVLVVKALETLGKRIVREDRARFHLIHGYPIHLAHVVWTPDEAMVSRVLRGAWDVVPAMLDTYATEIEPEAVQKMLDDYVRDLAVTGTEHNLLDLAYRFDEKLGIPVVVDER